MAWQAWDGLSPAVRQGRAAQAAWKQAAREQVGTEEQEDQEEEEEQGKGEGCAMPQGNRELRQGWKWGLVTWRGLPFSSHHVVQLLVPALHAWAD